MEWHALKKEDVLKALVSDKEGLTEREALNRLEKYGKNMLKEVYTLNPFKILLRQFKSFVIYILFIAIIISIAIKHYIDSSVIFAIVLLNTAIGFFQQYKAEKSIIQMRNLFIHQTKVFRNGRLKLISSHEIVPGDIVLFEEGDRVVADCRILQAENFEVNEAILTGESSTIEKYDAVVKEDGLISERLNMLYAGTVVVKGKARAIVIATGMSTEFGKIASKLHEITLPETPMQKKLDKFAKQISLIVFILAAITFFLGVMQGKDKIEMFLTSIALLVAAIPEGLPAIITVSLAFATNNMLKSNVLIRRLPAAETLGSVSIICSDKTGTMTEEKMFVTDVFCDNKLYKNTRKGVFFGNKEINPNKEKELFQLVKTSILGSNARFEEKEYGSYAIIGDPTESAFVSFALDAGINKKIFTEIEPRIKEISFSSERKMMSILRKSYRRNMLYCKGSASAILSKSAFELRSSGLIRLSEGRKKELLKIAENFERKGLRVIAFASKYVANEKNPDYLEQALTFAGFIGLMDPPRKEVRDAVLQCKNAGIKVKMITGDSILTAKTIAEQIGIGGSVIGGRELEEMSDEELILGIDNIGVFARTEPRQKLRIVEILQRKGENVAITGDGVNDILALKKADIGIAMGKRGSDIARDVSDMILLDDNFANIVKGVEEGRIVYDNSKKATKFLIASNLGELLLIAAAILLAMPLPLLPLQILWINLITDSIPALALTKEREKTAETLDSRPRNEKSLLRGILLPTLIASLLLLLSGMLVFYYGIARYDIEKTRTLVMLTFVGFETLFVLTCRTDKPLKEVGFFSNKHVIYAILIVFLIQFLLMITPLSSAFGLAKISFLDLILVFLASLPGLVVFEAWKMIRNKDQGFLKSYTKKAPGRD